MVTFAVARGGPAEPTAGSSFHPAFDKATPFPDKGLTIDGRVAPAVTILARYAGWGYRKPRFYGIIDTSLARFSASSRSARKSTTYSARKSFGCSVTAAGRVNSCRDSRRAPPGWSC